VARKVDGGEDQPVRMGNGEKWSRRVGKRG